MTTEQKLQEMRLTFEALQSHFSNRPECTMSPWDCETWFETLCQLLGAHHIALERISEIVHEYKFIGMGYMFTEQIQERPCESVSSS